MFSEKEKKEMRDYFFDFFNLITEIQTQDDEVTLINLISAQALAQRNAEKATWIFNEMLDPNCFDLWKVLADDMNWEKDLAQIAVEYHFVSMERISHIIQEIQEIFTVLEIIQPGEYPIKVLNGVLEFWTGKNPLNQVIQL